MIGHKQSARRRWMIRQKAARHHRANIDDALRYLREAQALLAFDDPTCAEVSAAIAAVGELRLVMNNDPDGEVKDPDFGALLNGGEWRSRGDGPIEPEDDVKVGSLWRSCDHRNLRSPWLVVTKVTPEYIIVSRYEDGLLQRRRDSSVPMKRSAWHQHAQEHVQGPQDWRKR